MVTAGFFAAYSAETLRPVMALRYVFFFGFFFEFLVSMGERFSPAADGDSCGEDQIRSEGNFREVEKGFDEEKVDGLKRSGLFRKNQRQGVCFDAEHLRGHAFDHGEAKDESLSQ